MTFFDVRLPEDVERGAETGPQFNSGIFSFANGHEARNRNRQQDRRTIDVGYGITTVAELEQVVSAFHVVGAQVDSFRFKDWAQFTIGNVVGPLPQLIGTGDAAVTIFQASKLYTFGSASYNKTITKLVSGTVSVYIDTTGVGNAYVLDGTAAVDLATGIITPTLVPGSGHLVGLVAEYDLHVRFNQDELPLRSVVVNTDGTVASIPAVQLIEVLSP